MTAPQKRRNPAEAARALAEDEGYPVEAVEPWLELHLLRTAGTTGIGERIR